jgi:Putative prokaryotic signal transducing protein
VEGLVQTSTTSTSTRLALPANGSPRNEIHHKSGGPAKLPDPDTIRWLAMPYPCRAMSEDLKIVATVSNEAEAEMVAEQLTEAGIRSMAQLSSKGIRLGAAAERDVYVAGEDYDRAMEALSAAVPSEEELEALSQGRTPEVADQPDDHQ